MSIELLEATVQDLAGAYKAREVSVREVARFYLDRVQAFDRNGPQINSVISLNPRAVERAGELDALLSRSGPVGPLHGIPIILKDQIDAQGMTTTLGSVLFKDYRPRRDAFVVTRLKQAGALILGKATLGELGMGDTHGSLFGSTRNPYDLERTVGGSSGGPAAAVSANLAMAGIGQEALASIRRPAAWTCTVGMRPTAGLVSRSGVYAGWPGTAASLGPLTRTVRDQAEILDVMVGYDAEDPLTALCIDNTPTSFAADLHPGALAGARIGVIRESIGSGSEPKSEDFAKVDVVFEQAVKDLAAAGGEVIDPVVIPGLRELLDKRSGAGGNADEAWDVYFSRGENPPFKNRAEMVASPDFSKVHRGPNVARAGEPVTAGDYLEARQELMFRFLNTMAQHRLDAIVHKSVEHQPTLIKDGVNPPYVNIKGATHLNTFLVFVPAISVPAGFTTDGLPVGITFTGRPYSDEKMLRLAYGFEQATHHRRPPVSTSHVAV